MVSITKYDIFQTEIENQNRCMKTSQRMLDQLTSAANRPVAQLICGANLSAHIPLFRVFLRQ